MATISKRDVFGIGLFVLTFVVVGIVIEFLCVTIGWTKPRPIAQSVVMYAVLGVSTPLMMMAERRGWIRSGLFTPNPALEERKNDLAADRERILAEAKAKAQPPG